MSKPEFDLLIKNTRVVRPHGNVVFDADIAITGGKVALVAPGIDITRAKAVHDGKHRLAFPGELTPTCTAAFTRRLKKTRSLKAKPQPWAA